MISLVTTFKNEENSISVFIESILNQSVLPDEIILVDGGSTDKTIEIVEKHIIRDLRIKLISKVANRSVCRNTGIEYAVGDIIAMTDAGCILSKDWIKFLTAPFKNDPTIDVVGGYWNLKQKTYFKKLRLCL